MGPGHGGPGEAQHARYNFRALVKLQWGRATEGPESTALISALNEEYPLQWGRATEGPERGEGKGKGKEGKGLQWGRATEGPESARTPANSRN